MRYDGWRDIFWVVFTNRREIWYLNIFLTTSGRIKPLGSSLQPRAGPITCYLLNGTSQLQQPFSNYFLWFPVVSWKCPPAAPGSAATESLVGGSDVVYDDIKRSVSGSR